MKVGAAPSDEPLVLCERRGPVAVVTLNRPAVRNALSFALVRELLDTMAALDGDRGVRVIVLTGQGGVFAAGADIAELAAADPAELARQDPLGLWQELRRMRSPVVAAVEGLALGGGMELALAADMIVAGEGARFGQPEIRLGMAPGAGGTQLLTRALGKWRAMEVVLAGRIVSGRELYEAGLVTRAVPDSQALPEAIRLAESMAAMPAQAVELAKEAVQAAFMAGLQEGLALERKNFYLLCATADGQEGMRAFLEKREPRWRGK